MQSEISETRQEYIKRINYVLDFVENNLDADLSLEQLSEKAHYSSFHFHRIFSAIVGETLNTLVNRKRIERIASILLVGTNQPINELACRYGFNNDNSFSRTFKKYYGVSPTEFKTEGKNILSKIGIQPLTMEKYICSIENINKWIDMNAQIEVKKLPEIKLAGVMHIGEFAKIGNTYERLFEWASQKSLFNSPNFKAITIYHDNPKVTQTSKVRLSVCITINEDIEAEGEVRQILVREGNYAIGHFEITADLFQKAWESMCMWVVENGFNFRDGDYFEVYNNDHKTHPKQKFIVDICVPIEKSHNNNAIKKGINQINIGNLCHTKNKTQNNPILTDYKRTLKYIKELRLYFTKEYPLEFKVGAIYQGNMDFTYFSIKTIPLKKEKLKFVVIFNHQKMQFEICLSGQNKEIRKRYWKIFRGSNWNKYHIPSTSGLSIVEDILIENPDFNNLNLLTEQIDERILKFINDITMILK